MKREEEPGIRIEIAARTDRGLHRSDNEDSLAVASLADGSGELGEFTGALRAAPGGVLLAVCDGMGGEAGGEVASRRAVEVLRESLLGARPGARRDLGRAMVEALESAAREVHTIARARPEIGRMGTTATVCALVDAELVIGQIGDSRAYLLRQGRLTQLTRDQTLATLLIEKGQLLPEHARDFELGHVILQALGTSDTVDVDLTSVPVCRGDVLLVCSDGLSGPVGEREIAATLAGAATAAEASQALIALANDAGGPDNVTCIVGRLDGDGLPPPRDDDRPVARRFCLAPEAAVTVPEPGVWGVPTEPEELAVRDTEPPASPEPGKLDRLRAFLGLSRRTTG